MVFNFQSQSHINPWVIALIYRKGMWIMSGEKKIMVKVREEMDSCEKKDVVKYVMLKVLRQ